MAILRVADTLILSPTFLVRMTIVFLNRKTFQDMSNLALFQLISTDFWLPEELKFSSLSLPFHSLGCGPTVWVPNWLFSIQYFTYDIRPVECIIWRDGMLYVKNIPSEFLIRDRLSRNYGRDDGIEELFRRIFEK